MSNSVNKTLDFVYGVGLAAYKNAILLDIKNEKRIDVEFAVKVAINSAVTEALRIESQNKTS